MQSTMSWTVVAKCFMFCLVLRVISLKMFIVLCTRMLTWKVIGRIMQHALLTGLEEVMEFLEQSYPNVEIAIAHGKVIFLYIVNYVDMLQLRTFMHTLLSPNWVLYLLQNT